VALVGLWLAATRGTAAAACHSSCTQQLAECKRTCPGGGAIAVWVLSPGHTTFTRGAGKVYRLQDTSTFGPAHRNAQWMDLRGQPQAAPGMQTRGVILGGRERVWVDVFPQTTGLTALPPR